MLNEITSWILNNKDKSMPVILSSGISMSVAIVGWIVIQRQQKKLLKNNAKLKIYEGLSDLVKNYNKTCIVLGVLLNKFSAPFLQMGLVDRNLDSIQKNYEGIKIWQSFTEKIGKEISNFSETYLEIWNYLIYWTGDIPKLKNMQKELFWKRHGKLVDELWKFQRYLQGLSTREFVWEKWDRNKIDSKFDEIDDKFVKESAYFDDFMTEIHNTLAGEVFSHRKKKREGFDKLPEEYEVLTTSGGLKKIKKTYFLKKSIIRAIKNLQEKLRQFFNVNPS